MHACPAHPHGDQQSRPSTGAKEPRAPAPNPAECAGHPRAQTPHGSSPDPANSATQDSHRPKSSLPEPTATTQAQVPAPTRQPSHDAQRNHPEARRAPSHASSPSEACAPGSYPDQTSSLATTPNVPATRRSATNPTEPHPQEARPATGSSSQKPTGTSATHAPNQPESTGSGDPLRVSPTQPAAHAPGSTPYANHRCARPGEHTL